MASSIGSVLPSSILTPNIMLAALLLGSTTLIITIVYRLHFHALSHVPGPRLAALTDYWSYYHELKGTFPFYCRQLSVQHNSPVIRVGPNRVVIHDSTQYEKIYSVGTKFMKDPSYYHAFPSGQGGLTTTTSTDKKYHADRRKLSSAKMSRGNVNDLHDLVASKVSMLMKLVNELARNQTPINVYAAWRSMTLDIISTFAFGHSLNALDRKDLDHEMLDTLESALGAFYIFNRIPLVLKICQIPVLNWAIPGVSQMGNYKKWARECVESYRPHEKTKYLFDSLLNPPEGDARLSKDEVQSEAEELLIAGSDTTATTLTYACMHLARDPQLWERLYQEILPLFKDTNIIPRSKDLETLPLLTACLKESLRLATPVPAYLWRVVPESGYEVCGQALPPTTSIGMSAWTVHYDPAIFPSPETYDHSRWLGDAGNGLDRFLVPFSKGTRQCGGINLAWMELYIGLASMVRRFKPQETDSVMKVMEQREFFVGMLTDAHWDVLYKERDE